MLLSLFRLFPVFVIPFGKLFFCVNGERKIGRLKEREKRERERQRQRERRRKSVGTVDKIPGRSFSIGEH